MLGKKHSDETKRRKSMARLGKKISNETRQKLRLVNMAKYGIDPEAIRTCVRCGTNKSEAKIKGRIGATWLFDMNGNTI